jgi:hypothetical protein
MENDVRFRDEEVIGAEPEKISFLGRNYAFIGVNSWF